MSKRAVTFLMIGVIAVVMFAGLLIINRTTIFQEGNPIPVAKGIYALLVNHDAYAKIKDNPPVYVTRADTTGDTEHARLFAHIEGTYDVKFTTESGSRYYFTGEDGEKVTLVTRHYSRSFQVWELSEEK